MKRFKDTEAWKWIRTGLEILLVVLAVIAVIFAFRAMGISEAHGDSLDYYDTAYAICATGDRVNIRMFPNRKQDPIGWLELGDEVTLDGQKKNGFYHCVGLPIEGGEGWVHGGYLVSGRPVPVGRIAYVVSNGKVHARQNVGGKHIRWLKPLTAVKVYSWSDEWACTDQGYVQSRFLELEGE